MQRFLHRARGSLAWAFAASFILIASGVAYADDTRHASTATSDELWRRSISLVSQGDFSRAVETIRRVPSGTGLTDKVRTWLEDRGFLNKKTGRRSPAPRGVTLNGLTNAAMEEYFERRHSDRAFLIFLDTRIRILKQQIGHLRDELERNCRIRDQVAEDLRQKTLKHSVTVRQVS